MNRIKLLEEIRDLQKQHVESYRGALKNQQESIELQKRMARRQRMALIVFGIFLMRGDLSCLVLHLGEGLIAGPRDHLSRHLSGLRASGVQPPVGCGILKFSP